MNKFNQAMFLALVLVGFHAHGFDVSYTSQSPHIDGMNDDEVWNKAVWRPMQHLIVGSQPNKADFNGRFRLLWDNNFLYLQAEITDDILIDQHADPLHYYWDDDCLEVFIDSDASGGDHQFNHSAFAYHIALDNQAVDIGEKQTPILLNEHIKSQWKRQIDKPNTIIWEVAIKMYSNDYKENATNLPISLTAGQTIGFMLAYCDNDGSVNREHFVASNDVKAVNGDKNRGWIDSSVFGSINLVKAK